MLIDIAMLVDVSMRAVSLYKHSRYAMLVEADKIAMCMRMTVVTCMIVIVTVVVNMFLLLHIAVCIKFGTKLYNQTI